MSETADGTEWSQAPGSATSSSPGDNSTATATAGRGSVARAGVPHPDDGWTRRFPEFTGT